MLTAEQVLGGLHAQINYATKQGRAQLEVNAGELERRLGASNEIDDTRGRKQNG